MSDEIAYFVIGRDGRQYGPASQDQVREWLAANLVTQATLSWCVGETAWVPLHLRPEFRVAAAGTSQAAIRQDQSVDVMTHKVNEARTTSAKTWISAAAATIGVLASAVAIWAFVTGRTTLLRPPASELIRTPWLGLQVFQADQRVEILREDTWTVRLNLRAEPFELRLPKRGMDDAYKLCAWTDDSIFKQIDQGMPLENHPYFGKYRGMADTDYASAMLFLRNDAHSYLKGERLGAEPTYHSVYYSSLWRNRETSPIHKTTIYIVAYFDKNNDQIIDNGEYEFIVLQFL